MNLVTYEVAIRAPAETVYRHLTTVDGLTRWIAADAVVEPTAGGILRWTHDNGATMAGRFVELVPPRRLVFRYGWEGALMGLPPESSIVEIELEEREGETILRLTHRGIPPDVVGDHRRGWIYFLGRLRDTLAPGG
ncbi:MAG TPA: SRPBCC domain-containing protein [Actinomycetota bacterium]|nr:SRPBCC domain-containing protein [Actinomycetota bacterium]